MRALRSIGCMVWRQQNVPTPIGGAFAAGHEHEFKGFRSAPNKGMADIGGITPGGRAIQVEVKRPGQLPSQDQVDWLNRVSAAGGIAMLATSVDDVADLYEAVRMAEQDSWSGWQRVAPPWSHHVPHRARPERQKKLPL